MLEPLKLDNQKFQHQAYAYDSLNHQLYHLVQGRIESIDTKTNQKHKVHFARNNLETTHDPSNVYPKLIKVSGQIVFNTQKTIATNLSAQSSIVRSNVPIATNATWSWHIPHSLYDVKLGIMKQSEKNGHQYVFFDLKSSTSRTVTFAASENSVQVWVNGIKPSKLSQKKIQLKGEKWYAYAQIQQKGNTIIFTPFGNINNQIFNYFSTCQSKYPDIVECNQKDEQPSIVFLQQLSSNKILTVSSDNQAKIIFRNPRTNKFEFPRVTIKNGNIHGLFSDFQKQKLKKFCSQQKLNQVKWQNSYKISEVGQLLNYLIYSALASNKKNTATFQILIKKLAILRPHLNQNLSNLIFQLNLDEQNYSQANKYFPELTRALQIEKEIVLNESCSTKIEGKIVEATQNYLLTVNDQTITIYHLGNYIREVYKQNVVFFEFNKNSFLDGYDQTELSALKKGSNSSIYKLLADCLHKDKKNIELFQVKQKDVKQLVNDYKISEKQAKLALQQTGNVDQALVWLSRDEASRQYIGKHSEKSNEQAQQVICSMVELNHPLARILLHAKNNIYLLGLNPKALSQFYRKTDKQIVNLVDFKRQWSLQNVDSEKWFSSRNHQNLTVLDYVTFKENLSFVGLENSQIVVVKNQEQILMKSVIQIKYNQIFEITGSISVSQFTAFQNFIDSASITKTCKGQLIYKEKLNKQQASNTTVFCQGKIYNNSNFQTDQFVDLFAILNETEFKLPIKSKQGSEFVPLLIEKGPPGCNLNYPISSILYPKSSFLANYPHQIKFKHLHSKYMKIQSVVIQRSTKRKNVNEVKGGYVYFENECGLRSKKYHFIFEQNEQSKQVKINEQSFWKYIVIQPEFNNKKRMPYEIGFIGAKGTSIQYEVYKSQMIKFLEKSITASILNKNVQVRVQNFEQKKDRLLKLRLKLISQSFKVAELKITTNKNIENFFGLSCKNQVKEKQNYEIKDLDQLTPKNFNKLFIQNRNIQYLIIKQIVKLDNFSFIGWESVQIRKFIDLVFGKVDQLKEESFAILLEKILLSPEGKKYFTQLCHDIGKCYITFPHQYLNCIIKKIEPLQLRQNLKDLIKCIKTSRSQKYNAIRQKKIPYLILEESFYSKYYLQKIDELENNATAQIYDEDLIATNETLVLKDDLSRRIIVKLDGQYSINQIVLRLDRSELSSRINFKLFKINENGTKILVTKNRILEHQWTQMTKFPYRNQMKQMFKSKQTILNAFGIDIQPFQTKYLQIQIVYTETGIAGQDIQLKNIPFIDILPQIYGHKVAEGKSNSQVDELFTFEQDSMFFLSKVDFTHNPVQKYSVTKEGQYEFTYFKPSCQKVQFLRKSINEKLQNGDYYGVIPLHKKLVNSYKQHSIKPNLDYIYTLTLMTLDQIFAHKIIVGQDICKQLFETIIKHQFGPIKLSAFKAASNSLTYLIKSLPYLDNYLPTLQQTNFHLQDIQKLVDLSNKPFCLSLNQLIIKSIPYKNTWAILLIKLSSTTQNHSQIIQYILKSHKWFDCKQILTYFASLSEVTSRNCFIKNIEASELEKYILKCKELNVNIKMDILIDNLIQKSSNKISLDIVSMMFQQKETKWNNLYRVIRMCPEAHDMILNQYLKEGQNQSGLLATTYPELLLVASKSTKHTEMFATFLSQLYNKNRNSFKNIILSLPSQSVPMHSDMYSTIAYYLKEQCNIGGIQGAKLASQGELTNIHIANLLIKNVTSLTEKEPLTQEQLYLQWYFCNNCYEFGMSNPASKSPVQNQIKILSENVLNLLKSTSIKNVLKVFDKLIKQIQSQNLPLSTKHIYTNQLNSGVSQLLGKSITPQSLGDILVENKMIQLIFNSINNQISDGAVKIKWNKIKEIEWADKFTAFTTVQQKVKDWEANRAGSKGILFKVSGAQRKFTMKSNHTSLISLSKILVGFNIIDTPQKNNILPSSIQIYGGQNQESLVRICTLSEIQDQHFYSFGVKVFGVNFNSLAHRRFSNPISILEFRIREPMLTSISDVFQNPQKNKKTSFYNVSFLSLMGYEEQPTTQPQYTELYSTLLAFLNNPKYHLTLKKVLADNYFKTNKKSILRTMNSMLPNQQIQKLLLAFNSEGEDVLESVLSADYPNSKLIKKIVLNKLSPSNISKVLDYSKSKMNEQILDIIVSSIKLSSYESNAKIDYKVDEVFNIFQNSIHKQNYSKLLSTILTTPTKFQFDYKQVVQRIWSKKERRQFYPLIASTITSYPQVLNEFVQSGKTQSIIEELGDNIHSNKDGYVNDGYNQISLIASLASHSKNRQYFIEKDVPTKVVNQLRNAQTLIVKYPTSTMNMFILFFQQTCIQSKCEDSFSQILIDLMVKLPEISSIHHNYFINNFFFPLINAFRGVAVKFVWRTNQNKYLYQATHVLNEKPIKGNDQIVEFHNGYYQPSDIELDRNKRYLVSQNGIVVAYFKDGKCFVNQSQTKFQFANKKITIFSQNNINVPSQNIVFLRQSKEELNHLTNQTLISLKNVGIFGANYLNSLPLQNSTFEKIYYLPVEMNLEDVAKQINICGYKLSNEAVKNIKVHNSKDHSLIESSLKLSEILQHVSTPDITLQIRPQDLFAYTSIQKISINNQKHVPFIPQQTIFRSFQKMKGLNKMIKVLTTCVQNWSNSSQSKIWHQYLNELQSYSCFPIFSSIYMNKKQNVGLLFDLLSGLPDKEDSKKWIDLQKSSVKFLYDIIKDVFEVQGSQAIQVRKYAIQNGFYKTMLDRLHLVTKQPKRAKVDVQQQEQEDFDLPDIQKKNSQQEYKQKVVKKKGVGYGNDSSSNQKWDVTGQQQVRKQLSEQILGLLRILEKFLDHKDFVPTQQIVDESFESALLPILQSSLRGGSLLQISKAADLFKGELSFIRAIAKNRILVPILMQVPKTYQPKQPESIHSLLKVLQSTSKIFLSCLTGSVGEKLSQQMAKDIIQTFNLVDEAVSNYQIDNIDEDEQKKILELPLAKKYPLLLKDLRFDYIDMKDKNGKITKHHYASYYTPNHKSPPQKTIRLAQQLADISHALPIDHTNAIFVRCDKERVDYMQALIMGSNGTPYGHGAYLFDIYFEDTYPNGPPKVNLTTTGNGAIRFNPNLYACGKVCLSLLGTWRGNAMENWDAKVSTLLQVLVSIQSIIMSEQIYFNQPGFEHQQGTVQGQKKNQAYANVVRHGNIKYAMVQNLKNPPKGFQNIIRRHFYLKKDEILQECRKWVKYAQKRQASYTGLVSDHNNNWCNQFRKSKTQYKTSLEKAIKQLQIQLQKLKQPHASDLKSLNSSPKKQKKKVKIVQQSKDQNLDDVDVTYDKNQVNNLKQLDINDEKVKDRWSRYIGAMGIEAVSKQSKANILLFGLGSTGVQIAKNIVLSGCKKISIVDEQLTTWRDLSGQFFLNEDDIGKNRVEACIYKLQQLNHYVKVQNIKFSQDNLEVLKSYDVVILTQQSLTKQKLINNYCHQNSIKFIITDCYGPYGQVFNDFGTDFQVLDKNGEQTVQVMIQSITNAQEGVVTLLKGQRHPYEDGEAVRITAVKGMIKQNEESINGTIHKIKVINQFSFKIGNTSEYSAYEVDGLVRNMKLPIKVSFKKLEESIAECNIDGNLAFYDFEKSTKNSLLHKCLLTLSSFKQKNNKLPTPWNWEDGETFISLLKQSIKDQLKIEQLNYARQFSYTCSGNFAPLSAFYGGLTAQEAFKAITGKYMPVNQFFFTQFTQVIPQLPATDEQIKISLTNLNYKSQESRLQGMRIVVGDDLNKAIQKCKVFMIGSGAIGCQLLKNFAMINLSTAQSTEQEKGGMIVVTDPDHIQQSNLNRQFLFRQKHLRKPKSVTAAAAVAQMNKLLKGKIRAKLDRVCETTKDIFSNEFFESLDIVSNALDNVKARQYVDQRCVENKIALLESGTLSSKGHVQVIIPYKTQTYGSKNDPAQDGEIPHCTLKMFPEETLHCVQWARDIFGKAYTLGPKALLKLVESWKDYTPISSDLQMLKGCVKMMESRPRNFDQAVFIATNKFFQLYRNDIMQLLYTYPLDAKTKDGKPFWKLPKRPPTPVQQINPEEELHRTFITSYAVLLCKIFNVPYPNDFRTQNRRKQIAKQASKIKIQPFVPSDKLAKQMASQVDNDEKDKNEQKQVVEKQVEGQMQDENTLFDQFRRNMQEAEQLGQQVKVTAEQFQKDDDQNGHIDLIYSMANLRAGNYKLDPMDWMTTKLKAGRITPALSTTTSCVAALQTIELIKYLKKCKLDKMRNTFINLAVPMIQAGEPGQVQKIKVHQNLTTNIWERWEIGPCKLEQITVKNLLDEVEKKYEIVVKTLSFLQGSQIYSDLVLGLESKKAQKQELFKKSFKSVLESEYALEDVKKFVDMTLVFSVKEEIAKHVPTIRLLLQ